MWLLQEHMMRERVVMKIRDHSREWIEKLARGTAFDVSDIYSYIQNRFPNECSRSGLTTNGEEKWKKDSRWPLQDLKMKNMVVHIGSARSGKWKRT